MGFRGANTDEAGYVTVRVFRRMNAEAPSVAAEVLLLAGNAEDVRLVRDAAQSSKVTAVEACPSVLAYVRREGEYKNATRPDLILLDIDLTNDAHCEVLKELKTDPSLRTIPVVVLTSPGPVSSMQKAYEFNANACVVKPTDAAEYVRVIRGTLNFWLNLARLPRE